MNTAAREQTGKTRHIGLLAVLLLALAARAAVLAPALVRPLDDPDNYLVLARSVAEGRGFSLNGRPTAYRPPLYPLLLAPMLAALGDRLPWGVAAAHLAMGVGTTALTVFTARRWGLRHPRPLLAGLIVALDPVLVAQSRSVMTETPAAFLVAASLAALSLGPRAMAAALGGLGFGLASLCRPSLLPAAGLAVGAALVVSPGTRRERAARAAILALATLATLAPWAVRNAFLFGEPVWTTTHGGYTLALANNPVYYSEVLDHPGVTVWSGPNQKAWMDAITRETAGLTEPAADRALRARAIRFAAERPRDFARASLARLGQLWAVAPSRAVYPGPLRIACALWTVPLWIALGAGLACGELYRWPRLLAPVILMTLTAVHLVFWTDLRMRAPMVPAIALIAAGARRFTNSRPTGDRLALETAGPESQSFQSNSR